MDCSCLFFFGVNLVVSERREVYLGVPYAVKAAKNRVRVPSSLMRPRYGKSICWAYMAWPSFRGVSTAAFNCRSNSVFSRFTCASEACRSTRERG